MVLSPTLILVPVVFVACILADDAAEFLAWCFLFIQAASFVTGLTTLIWQLCK